MTSSKKKKGFMAHSASEKNVFPPALGVREVNKKLSPPALYRALVTERFIKIFLLMT